MDERLPAHLEIAGLLRAVEAQGGFATVIEKGERDAGTILVICCQNGTNGRLYERMPQLDGSRRWTLIKSQDNENPIEFSDYYARRKQQDSDLWIVELDIANSERFIGIGLKGVDTFRPPSIWPPTSNAEAVKRQIGRETSTQTGNSRQAVIQ